MGQLFALGALKSAICDDLTQLGRNMSKFPLDPRFSKILLAAPSFDCLQEVSLNTFSSKIHLPASKDLNLNLKHLLLLQYFQMLKFPIQIHQKVWLVNWKILLRD